MKTICLLLFFLIPLSVYARGSELSFFFGPSIDQTGDLQDLGEPEANTGLEYNYFFNDNHGMGISFGHEFDFEGSSKFPAISDASMQTIDIHYALRFKPQNSKFRFTFTPGVGMQTLYDASRDYYWGYFYYESLSSAWVVDYKLMLDYIVKEWDEGDRNSSMFVGFGINQIFSLNDDYRGEDISGSRISGLFRFGFGF